MWSTRQAENGHQRNANGNRSKTPSEDPTDSVKLTPTSLTRQVETTAKEADV